MRAHAILLTAALVGTIGILVVTPEAGIARTVAPRTGVVASSPADVVEPEPGYHSVSIRGTEFFGWALLDRATGTITGSGNREWATNSTESMIKVWIASDYLRRVAAGGHTPSKAALRDLTRMIVDSDDSMAERYYWIDGGDAVIARLIAMCGLTGTRAHDAWWSKTRMSPADAVRYGDCVARGKAAGTTWTPWILATMTRVRGGLADQHEFTGGGRWGIISGLPGDIAATTSIKNGWTAYGGVWRVNCLAVQDTWVLAVMARYPIADGLRFGADVCASVTRQLLGTDPIADGHGLDRPIID